MAAITGRWTPPSQSVNGLMFDWMQGLHNRSNARRHLAKQLRNIKRKHGRTAASEFRNYLLWLGSYPTKRA